MQNESINPPVEFQLGKNIPPRGKIGVYWPSSDKTFFYEAQGFSINSVFDLAINEDSIRLNYLEHNLLEIDASGGWEEEPTFRVIEVTGNRNDRQHKCIGRGETIRDAIDSARTGGLNQRANSASHTLTGRLAELEHEAAWIRRKLNLPEDTKLLSGDVTLAGRLHNLVAHADGYLKYIETGKCEDKAGEIARQSVTINQLTESITSLQRLSVENILLRVEPGEVEGMGKDIYATSVEQIMETLEMLRETADMAEAANRRLHDELAKAREELRARAPVTPPLRPATAQAILDVLAERQRQVIAEGWTPEHDDSHPHGELASAAACYASMGRYMNAKPGNPPANWPWAPEWWKPTTYRKNLIKAGALIVAEIERLDRAAIANTGDQHETV